MSAQRPHDPPMTSIALTLARRWCHGHEIGGEPALAHAVRVARILHSYIPDGPPQLLAAALVHDAPDFAPPDEDLDTTLGRYMSPDVTCIVRALEREHETLAESRDMPPLNSTALVVSTADKLKHPVGDRRSQQSAGGRGLLASAARLRHGCALLPDLSPGDSRSPADGHGR